MKKPRTRLPRNFTLCEELESRHLMSAGLAAHIKPAGHLLLPATLINTHSSTTILPIRRDPSASSPAPTSGGSKFLDVKLLPGETFTGYLGTITINIPLGAGPVTSPVTTIDYDSNGMPTGMANVSEFKIFWGDGGTSQATLIQTSLGVYDLYGTHTYQSAGVYRTLVSHTTHPIQDPAYHGPPIAIPGYYLLWEPIRTAVITVGLTAPR